jgi:hypothetical protein
MDAIRAYERHRRRPDGLQRRPWTASTFLGDRLEPSAYAAAQLRRSDACATTSAGRAGDAAHRADELRSRLAGSWRADLWATAFDMILGEGLVRFKDFVSV